MQSKIKTSNPRYLIEKSLLDIQKLERFYKDKEYKNALTSARYFSSERFELQDLYEIELKIKEKLGLPENSLIKYEMVKCSKGCKHETHYYYYAYVYDRTSRKLIKKYIGKQLPLP